MWLTSHSLARNRPTMIVRDISTLSTLIHLQAASKTHLRVTGVEGVAVIRTHRTVSYFPPGRITLMGRTECPSDGLVQLGKKMLNL